MNNFCLGMVRQFQEIYFQGRTLCTVKDYSAPDFSAVAKAYGIDSFKSEAELKTFLDSDKPALLDVGFDQKTEVLPKLIVNEPLENMFPYLPEAELKENMVNDD